MHGEWRVNHEHNGVEVSFPGKPDAATIASLKANGFRWSGFSKVWYAKDYPYRREFLNTIATQGEDVAASGLSFAEKLQEKQERAEARRDRYDGYAESAQTEANRRFETAHNLVKDIPMGQPILVGHHSERAHRRTLERHDANMGKAFEAQHKAEYLSDRATSAGSQLKGYDQPDFLARRIKESEASIRKLEKNKRHHEETKPMRDAYLAWRAAGGNSRTDPGWNWEWTWMLDSDYRGDSPGYWENRIADEQSKLDFCQERLAALGGVKFGPDSIKKGDVILGEFGLGVVRRANPKSVTVDYIDPSIAMLNPAKCEYGRIKERKSAAEAIALMESRLAGDSPRGSAALENLRKYTA